MPFSRRLSKRRRRPALVIAVDTERWVCAPGAPEQQRPGGPCGARDSSITAHHPGPWEPLSPEQAAELLSPIEAKWWIAGGWAIDLLVGHQSRAHADLDVLILRPEQHSFGRTSTFGTSKRAIRQGRYARGL